MRKGSAAGEPRDHLTRPLDIYSIWVFCVYIATVQDYRGGEVAMLSALFGKKTDHPMADIKSAQALLEALPKGDAHKSLGELAEWIESVSDHDGFRPDHQFAVLRLL